MLRGTLRFVAAPGPNIVAVRYAQASQTLRVEGTELSAAGEAQLAGDGPGSCASYPVGRSWTEKARESTRRGYSRIRRAVGG